MNRWASSPTQTELSTSSAIWATIQSEKGLRHLKERRNWISNGLWKRWKKIRCGSAWQVHLTFHVLTVITLPPKDRNSAYGINTAQVICIGRWWYYFSVISNRHWEKMAIKERKSDDLYCADKLMASVEGYTVVISLHWGHSTKEIESFRFFVLYDHMFCACRYFYLVSSKVLHSAVTATKIFYELLLPVIVTATHRRFVTIVGYGKLSSSWISLTESAIFLKVLWRRFWGRHAHSATPVLCCTNGRNFRVSDRIERLVIGLDAHYGFSWRPLFLHFWKM